MPNCPISTDQVKKAAQAISRYGLHPAAEALKAAGAVYAISEGLDQGFGGNIKGAGWYIPMAIAMLASGAIALGNQIQRDNPGTFAKLDKGVQLGIELIEESVLFILFMHNALSDEQSKIDGPILFGEIGLAVLGTAIVALRSWYYRHQFNRSTLPFMATVDTALLPKDHLKSNMKQFMEAGLLQPFMLANLVWGISTLVAQTGAIPEELAVLLAMAATPVPLIKMGIEHCTKTQSDARDKILSHIGEALLGAVFPIALLMFTYVVATNNEEVPNAYFAFTLAFGLAIGAQRSASLQQTKPYRLPIESTSPIQVVYVDSDDGDDDDADYERRLPVLV